MPGHAAPINGGRSVYYVHGIPPEPKKTRWDMCNLPANPWVGVPIQFIEMLISITPSAFMPDILLHQFGGSYPISTITTGVCDSIGGALAFALSPSFGKWSDLYGRKRVIMILSLVSFLPIAFLGCYPFLNLWFYLSVRCFAKVSAYGILFSCISDVAPIDKRARLYGQTTGLGMTAMLIGPSISLALDAEWAFRVSALFALSVILYVQFLLPETLWVGLKRMQANDRLAAEEENAAINNVKSIDTTGYSGGMLAEDTLRTSLIPHPPHVVVSASSSRALHSPLMSPSSDPSDSTSELASPPSYKEASTEVASVPALPHLLGVAGDTTEHVQVSAEEVTLDDDPAVASSSLPSLNPCHALKAAWRTPLYRTVALIIFFSQLTDNGVHESAMFYLKHELAFTKDDNSILLMAMGGWSIIVLFVIMPLMLKKWDEKVVLVTALVLDQAHQLMYIVLPDKKYFWFIAFCQGSSYMSFPAANALLSGLVSDQEQGAVLAMGAGIRALTQGLAPVLFNGLLSYFTWHRAFAQFPAAPFLLSSACILTALALCLRLPKSDKMRKADERKEREKEEEAQETFASGYREVKT